MVHLTTQEKRVVWFGLTILLIGSLIQLTLFKWSIPRAVSSSQVKTKKLISINDANVKDLDSLPGLGKILAGRIIDFRRQHGPFTSLEQLYKVKGVTDKVYRKIYFRVDL